MLQKLTDSIPSGDWDFFQLLHLERKFQQLYIHVHTFTSLVQTSTKSFIFLH